MVKVDLGKNRKGNLATYTIDWSEDGAIIRTLTGAIHELRPTKDEGSLIGAALGAHGEEIAEAVKFAIENACSNAQGSGSPEHKAAMVDKRVASFKIDEWKATGERGKVLFPILVLALLETRFKGADRAKVERKVGAWSEEERVAILADHDDINEAYESRLGKPKHSIDTSALLSMLDDDEE